MNFIELLTHFSKVEIFVWVDQSVHDIKHNVCTSYETSVECCPPPLLVTGRWEKAEPEKWLLKRVCFPNLLLQKYKYELPLLHMLK